MQKIILTLAMIFIGYGLAGGQTVVAAEIIDCSVGSSVCDDYKKVSGDDNELFGSGGLVTKFVRTLSLVVGVVSVFIMAYAGLTYITSTGDTKKISTAKNTILYAAIGLIIALLAQSITSFILVNIK